MCHGWFELGFDEWLLVAMAEVVWFCGIGFWFWVVVEFRGGVGFWVVFVAGGGDW